MFSNQSAYAVPVAIALWSPLRRRVIDGTVDFAGRARAAWKRWAERRAQLSRMRHELAALSALDARTLRDMGLGDFAASARDSDDAVHRRALELRGF